MAKGRERSAKWYFRNEEEVMEELGLKPTPGSGNKWTHKEDGENDHILAQLKSTDKESYKLNKLDIERLEYNAMVANKVPMFILQFLKDNSRYALVDLEDIPKINEYINTGKIENTSEAIEVFTNGVKNKKAKKPKKKIKSSASAREQFYKDKEEYYEELKFKK